MYARERWPEGLDPERAWIGTLVASVLALLAGSLAFTRTVWNGFLWHYFWGPVYADAHNAVCAAMDQGSPALYYSRSACSDVRASGAIVAEPGYTVVSEVGYVVTLAFFLVGVFLLLRRLDVADDLGLYYPLVPFMLFGGALRVVEDAFDAARLAGQQPPLGYPLSTLLISPLIYGTVFGLTLGALVAAIRLEERGRIADYRRAMTAVGTVAFGATLGYLALLAATTTYVDVYPQMLLAVVVLSTGIAYGLWRAVGSQWPDVRGAVGAIGAFVLWGQAVDGVANVITSDWLGALGVPGEYTAKHPANRIIVDVTGAVQPEGLSALVGTSWPFLVVKLVVGALVVSLFTDEFVEESPRYALLLLVAVTAVGLGPGTRDALRVTFGI